jgi:AcrR family transcriptional regulator
MVTSSGRRERERERHRAEILDAAERVFAESGYHQATVEEIARTSDFSVGSIYNFFPSKRNLYQEVIERLAELFRSDFVLHVSGLSDPVEQLTRTIDLRLRFVEEHFSFMRFFFIEASTSYLDMDSILPEKVRVILDELNESIVDMLRRGMAEGKFRKEDPGLLCLCIDGMLKAFASNWTIRNTQGSLSAAAREMKRLILEFVKEP